MTAEQIAGPVRAFLLPMPRTLPILDNLDDIRIASPCNADWDAMKAVAGDDLRGDAGARARFCGSCQKNVYDLSSMTRVDALALIERHEGSCCVRFYKRADGTVLTEDCPVGFRAALRRAHLKTLSGIATCAGAVAAVVAVLLGSANPISKRLGTFEAEHTAVAGGLQAMPVPMMGEPPLPETTTPEPVPVPEVEMGRMLAPQPKTPKHKMGKMAPLPRDDGPPAEVMGTMMTVD